MPITVAGCLCYCNDHSIHSGTKPHILCTCICINTSAQLLRINLQSWLWLLCSSVWEDACSVCCCKALSRTVADGHSKKHEFWERHRVDVLKASQQREGSWVFCLLKNRSKLKPSFLIYFFFKKEVATCCIEWDCQKELLWGSSLELWLNAMIFAKSF